MNIKKNGGKSTSEYETIKKHIDQNFIFLQKEIDIISPEIIILGISFWRNLMDPLFPAVNWIKSGYDIFICKYNQYKIIDFYHPSSRNGPPASYSLLQNVVESEIFDQL
jgi:hypothetical protein